MAKRKKRRSVAERLFDGLEFVPISSSAQPLYTAVEPMPWSPGPELSFFTNYESKVVDLGDVFELIRQNKGRLSVKEYVRNLIVEDDERKNPSNYSEIIKPAIRHIDLED